jgi:multicomponent Na+:H+ antiporter subunit B
MMLAFGKNVALGKISEKGAEFFESFGAILFWFLALVGFTGGYYFMNMLRKGEPFRLFSSGMIPLYNMAIAFKVGAGLFTIFMALVFLRIIINKDDK